MKPEHVALLLVLLLAFAVPACMSWDDLERQREQARERAGEEVSANVDCAASITEAIDAYEEVEAGYPDELAALVPTYLSAIPRTVTGDDFAYERDDRFGQGYYLCFDVSVRRHPGCCYHRRLMLWDCSGGCE